MSLTVDGIAATTFTFASVPHTLLSPSFATRLGQPRSTGYLFTVTVGPSGAFSFPLHCSLGPQSTFDVVLGYDWAAFLRDSLLRSGFRLDSRFDAWMFFSYHLPPPSVPPAPATFIDPRHHGPTSIPYYANPISQYGTFLSPAPSRLKVYGVPSQAREGTSELLLQELVSLLFCDVRDQTRQFESTVPPTPAYFRCQPRNYMADDSDTYAMHRAQGLRRYTGWLFGEIDFVGVLGGVLLESWFGSAFNTRVETKENTFWLHVMAQSPEIYKTLAKTFKVECVIKCKATLQRANIPNNSTNMIERSYTLLSSTLRISPPGDVPCKGLGYGFKVANGKLRAGEAGDR
ncbi:hypothetical protein DFH09DRAFT_1273279 [Mycena vulgaris]|nr:hypothetical protein DFH09DRAFT_1273279 [Mycena vulgaris]